MVPLRDATTRRLLVAFKEAMAQRRPALICVEEDAIMGQDDWGEDGEVNQVECWWGIFQREER